MIAVLSVSSLVAFVVNDTGVAAAAPGFMYALTALAYPAFLLERTEPLALRLGLADPRKNDDAG